MSQIRHWSVQIGSNYANLFRTVPYVNWFANWVIQSIGFSIASLAICALGGFALAKYQLRGRAVNSSPACQAFDDLHALS